LSDQDTWVKIRT